MTSAASNSETQMQTDSKLFRLAIVILNFRTPKLCIDAVASAVPQVRAYGAAEILVVDGGSGDESASRVQAAIIKNQWRDVVTQICLTENAGFAAGNNAGIHHLWERHADYQAIWLLNPDTVLRQHALAELVRALQENPGWGIVGSRLEDPDGTSQKAARQFPGILNELDSAARFGPLSRLLSQWQIAPPEQNVQTTCDWLPGASLLVRREVLESIGLLDEGFFMYFEEVDFCKRALSAGFQTGYAPSSRVIHLVGQASGVTSSQTPVRKRLPQYWYESRGRYFLRHYGKLGFLAANCAWLMGHLCHRAVSLVLRRSVQDPPKLLSDGLAYILRADSWQTPGAPRYKPLTTTTQQE